MSKRIRQYMGILAAVSAYYAVHEGAHLLCALIMGTFRRVNIMALGMQIDVYAECMTELQLGIFCAAGSAATLAAAYILVWSADQICRVYSKIFKACMYYITIAMLFLDPVYLSLLCGLFGGGDMNGIAMLTSEFLAKLAYTGLFAANLAVFFKLVLPKYRYAFNE